MNRLLLIDGSYYVYRSFFAHPTLCNQRGEPTGAIYGFVKAVARMLRHVQPTHAAVIWDGIPKRRQAIQPGYKQHREGRCEDMTAQWSVIERIVPMMGMQGLRDPDAESDDLMASYAGYVSWNPEIQNDGGRTILATADKDLYACVNESTLIYSTSKADRADKEFALIDEAAVIAKWGVKPSQFSDLLALMGDDSDGIIGLKGVGPKIAAKWIKRYDNAIRAINCECQPADAEMVLRNLQMTKLDTDLALPAPLESLALHPFAPEFRGAMEACDINVEAL